MLVINNVNPNFDMVGLSDLIVSTVVSNDYVKNYCTEILLISHDHSLDWYHLVCYAVIVVGIAIVVVQILHDVRSTVFYRISWYVHVTHRHKNHVNVGVSNRKDPSSAGGVHVFYVVVSLSISSVVMAGTVRVISYLPYLAVVRHVVKTETQKTIVMVDPTN